MPPKASDEIPKNLRPYKFHGIDARILSGDQAVATCPFCGKDKFYIGLEEGLWSCKVCGSGTGKGGGNVFTFLRLLWEMSDKSTKPDDYRPLAVHRGLLLPETLMRWGVVKSHLTGEWMIPGYGIGGNLLQLYKAVPDGGKFKLLPTPTLSHQIHGVNLWDAKKSDVFVCEGPWDGMALWETLRCSKGGMLTANESQSMLASCNVIAVPGCTTFPDEWAKLVAGKNVTLLFDSDHEKEINGKTVAPAGYAGMRRIATTLAAAEETPATVSIVRWGENGFDPELPTGHDVRDHLKPGTTMALRVKLLAGLLSKCAPIPEDWVAGRSKESAKTGKTDLECLKCTTWRELQQSWKKAMKWTDGLDVALSVMLSSVASTMAVGDQLWVKIISPASSGKSTLCEAVSVAKKYVLAKSTIRGFHSGFNTTGDEKEDNSLLAQVNGKTLVTKDGDTLLQSPNLGQILAEARDVYDRTSRTHYRNKMSKDYEGVSMTWLLCGTSSLRSIDSSELGERFLDCVIMESIDDEMEDEILLRVATRVDRTMGMEVGKGQDQHAPEMTAAYQLTGGYVTYLRTNSRALLDALGESSEASLRKCIQLAKFVAHMRARPSLKQDESAEREFSTRLLSQLLRLGKCLAIVLNRKTLDDEVMRRVRKVALDTARGKVLEICTILNAAGTDGIELAVLNLKTGTPDDKSAVMMRFLRRIGVCEWHVMKVHGVRTKPKWRLTDKMSALWATVMGE